MAIQKHTKVFTVLSFLRLRSPDIYWYQWIYPTILFLIIFSASVLLEGHLVGFDRSKLASDINVLMGVLIGFYIAALAAVSSFTNENLDQIMKGRSPSIKHLRQGEEITEKLTRRRFLAILFGYCASVSIILFIFGVLQTHIAFRAATRPWVNSVLDIAKEVAWAGYTWLLASLLVVTLLGLHYLVERMHRA
ncbi:hypothetical protein [Roseovarius sp. MBR-6]|jgi:hypothetical protein|uniref:hypothetical protein n=1 Tax=Roseovarius sp. MBR-6 TaxID=3156459 RepID=UPI003396933E